MDWGGLAFHPGESKNTLSRFMIKKSEIKAGLMSHYARAQTLRTPFIFGWIHSTEY